MRASNQLIQDISLVSMMHFNPLPSERPFEIKKNEAAGNESVLRDYLPIFPV